MDQKIHQPLIAKIVKYVGGNVGSDEPTATGRVVRFDVRNGKTQLHRAKVIANGALIGTPYFVTRVWRAQGDKPLRPLYISFDIDGASDNARAVVTPSNTSVVIVDDQHQSIHDADDDWKFDVNDDIETASYVVPGVDVT